MRNEKGFTLVELLAVIVIIATILAIAIPRLLNINNSLRLLHYALLKKRFIINGFKALFCFIFQFNRYPFAIDNY